MEIITTEGFITEKEDKPDAVKEHTTLIEDFVDDEYKLEAVTEKCDVFFNKVLSQFTTADPIPFKMIAEWAESEGYSYNLPVMWMRMLWKAGRIRRFYQGLWQNAVQGNVTGRVWGVHYKIR